MWCSVSCSASRSGSAVTTSSWTGRGSPQLPTSMTRSRSPSRSHSAAWTCSHGMRDAGDVEGVAGAADPARRPRAGPGQQPLARRDRQVGAASRPPHHDTVLTTTPSCGAQGEVAQLATVLLQRDELAEHPVVLGGVLDRVGALQSRLHLGDPALSRQLLEPVDVLATNASSAPLVEGTRLDRQRATARRRRSRRRRGRAAAPPSGRRRRRRRRCARPAPRPPGRSGG